MEMAYEDIVRLAGIWGMLLAIAIFVIAATYALWPKNRAKFEHAARLPLDDADPPPPARERKP